jgi:hypothetical protein
LVSLERVSLSEIEAGHDNLGSGRLTAMLRVAVDMWIGNAAAVLSGCWGAVTRRAHETGYSRTAIYHHAQRVEQAVVNEPVGGISYEALWADNVRLRAENEALWEAWAGAEPLPEAKQHAFAATGSAMGLSLGQIITLLAIFLPSGAAPSRATVGRWVAQASRQAGDLLALLDQLCQRWVLVRCLDEIFFHREPILMALEPHSMAWVAAQRGPDRSGESWCELLTHWPCVERVVTDAGTGLERGVKLVNEARATEVEGQEATAARPIQMGLDVFHTQHELQRVLQCKWRRAERQLEAAAQADATVAQSKRRGQDARGVAQQAWRAWQKAERLFEEAVQAEAAAHRIETALAVFRPDGGLSDRQWAHTQLHDATALLIGQEWGKVRRFLNDQRTLNHLDWVHAQLDQVVAEPLLREALVRLWSLRDALAHIHSQQHPRLAQLVVIEQVVCQRLCPEWQSAYERVAQILGRVVRASSAVECINSVVRMHQARHRHVSQGLWDLKRLYWNCRAFRHGKRQGTCPYALLGLKLPTYDWWELLQMEYEELAQKLSTQEVAA